MRELTIASTLEGWQEAARGALAAEWPPEEIDWRESGTAQPGLPLGSADAPPHVAHHTVPRKFLDLAKLASCHSDPRRWALLYRVLWRLTHGERHLLEIITDPDVNTLLRWEKSVRRDVHKMRAFVRFRAVDRDGDLWYVAWFEPEHHVVELNSAFFIERFAQMRWSILTPDRCAHWDGKRFSLTPGASRKQAPDEDEIEALWLTYYSHIFNPARVKEKAMLSEMPRKYWRNLPEASVIPDLLARAPRQVETMLDESMSTVLAEYPPAPVPESHSLSVLRHAAEKCRACPLYRDATHLVFGKGPRDARIVFVGEQPGDREDLAGEPFVGPAGKLFDQALKDAGIDRSAAYVTNAVKHFKFEMRGKRRIHKTPAAREISACRPWVEAEIDAIRPAVLVCLGGTAAHSLLGSEIKVMRDRGKVFSSRFSDATAITVHPSAILRISDESSRRREYEHFVADLKSACARKASTPS